MPKMNLMLKDESNPQVTNSSLTHLVPPIQLNPSRSPAILVRSVTYNTLISSGSTLLAIIFVYFSPIELLIFFQSDFGFTR